MGKGKVKEKRSAGNADAGTGTSKHGDGKCTPGDTEADAAAPQASPPILLKMMDGTFAMDRLEIVKTGAIHNVDGTRMGLQLGSDFLDRHQGVLDKENEELRLQSGDETFFIPLIRPRKTIGFGPSDPAPKLARDGTKPDVGDGEL
uniref:Uncharacterized protein n=1 Tax=Craspedostauros australis TaxID=1486917 RepID=A0A7R9ZLX7_9STRA